MWKEGISTEALALEMGLDSMDNYVHRRQVRYLGHVFRTLKSLLRRIIVIVIKCAVVVLKCASAPVSWESQRQGGTRMGTAELSKPTRPGVARVPPSA